MIWWKISRLSASNWFFVSLQLNEVAPKIQNRSVFRNNLWPVMWWCADYKNGVRKYLRCAVVACKIPARIIPAKLVKDRVSHIHSGFEKPLLICFKIIDEPTIESDRHVPFVVVAAFKVAPNMYCMFASQTLHRNLVSVVWLRHLQPKIRLTNSQHCKIKLGLSLNMLKETHSLRL